MDELSQALFDSSDDAVLIARLGRISAVNRRAVDLSGYRFDEIAGLALSSLLVSFTPAGALVPFDVDALKGDDQEAGTKAGGVRRPDGTVLPVHIATRRLTDSRLLVRFRGVSAPRETEDREWTFQSLVESAQDVIFISDVTGRFVYVNSAAAETLGTTQDAVIGKSVDELFPPSVAARYRAGVADVVRTGRTLNTEDRLDLGGRTLWFNSIVQPVRDREGRITAAQGFIRNVTGLKEAEASLRRNEERLRQAVRVAHIGIFDHDHRSGVIYWSAETREIYGWDRDEPVRFDPPSDDSTSTWQLVYPDDRDRVARALEQAHSSPDGQFDIDYRILRRDGSVRWLTTRSQTFFEGEGPTRQAVRTIGALRDVTAVKEAERALRLNEERLRQVTRLAKIGIFDHDHRTGSVYWSREARDIYGLDPERPVFFEHRPEVRQPGWVELLHPDDRARALDAVREAHESEHGVFELEHRIVRPDGEIRWVNARSQTFFEGETRRPLRTIGAVRDVTMLKEAEQAIRGNEERLRQVTRVAKIGIFDHDHRTGSVYWSPEMRQIHEWGADEQVRFERTSDGGRVPADVILPEDRQHVEAAIQRAHDSDDGLFDLEYRLTGSGGIRWVRAQSQTFFEGHGADRRAVRTIGATVDITDRKAAEAERERLHAQLLQAQKMETVGRLAGGVAHDFNNMLNVIGGYAELALRDIDSASPLYTPLLEIQNASRRSADLTRQLLAFARKQPVRPKVLDLNRLIEGSLNMLRRLIGEDIQLEWQPRELWPTRIDPAQVDQVLMNLVVNARDAIAGHGHITVRTRNIRIDDRQNSREPWIVPGDYVALEIADDGRGLDEETKAHMFEPFFSTKGEGRGTGLGLATVYGIVKQNSGVVTVDSAPGQGTTLTVLLPRVTDATIEVTDASEERAQRGSERLLLVEDEPMVLRLTARMLEALGYTVVSTSAPAEAMRLAQQQAGKFDLLVTDMVMPETSGRVLADQLRALYPGLKCLFVSGYFPESGRMNVRGEGDHILQKPFSKRELAAKVREVLDAY